MGKAGRACVTGGAGFIGAFVVRELLERGFEVNVIDDLSVGRSERVPREARMLVGDILDPSAMREAVQDCNVVLHLAARVAIRSSFEFAVDDARTNYCGTAAVIRAAENAGVRSLIYASSMGVYADSATADPISEAHPVQPISPYGVSKLAGEMLVHLMCARSGMSSVVLRLFNTYGVGQQYSPYVGVVTIFARRLAERRAPEIFGDGEQRRDFVHVSDVASAFVAAALDPPSGETINVGSGVALSVNQVLGAVQGALGARAAPVYRDPAPGELRNSVADIGKAHRLLGYAPQRDFLGSIEAIVNDIIRGAT
jgi:UDP-glucose 4-epimerase